MVRPPDAGLRYDGGVRGGAEKGGWWREVAEQGVLTFDGCVAGEKGEAICNCLGDEQPVEEIAMVRVEVLEGEEIFVAKRQEDDAELCELIAEEGHGRGEIAEAA